MPKAQSDPYPEKNTLFLWALQCGSSCKRSLAKKEYVKAMLEDIGKRPILKRWILSIDIGYRNFAYCIMDSSNRSIVEWRNIELFDQGYPEAYNVSIYCQAVIRINVTSDLVILISLVWRCL